MSLKSLLRVCALATATVASAGSAFAATEWTMASGYPESSFFTQNIRKFIEAVEERTNGELKIDLRSNDSLIKLDNIKRAVQSGQVPIGEIRMGVYGNEQEMFNLDNIPGVVPTFEKSWKLMEAGRLRLDLWTLSPWMRAGSGVGPCPRLRPWACPNQINRAGPPDK